MRSQIKQMVDGPDELPEFGFGDYRGMTVIDYEYLSLLELSDEWLSSYLRHSMNYSGIHGDDIYVAVSGRFKLVEIDNWKNVVSGCSDLSIVDLLQCDMNFLKAYIASIEQSKKIWDCTQVFSQAKPCKALYIKGLHQISAWLLIQSE